MTDTLTRDVAYELAATLLERRELWNTPTIS